MAFLPPSVSTQHGVIHKLAEGALNLAMSLMRLLNSTGPVLVQTP